MKKSLLLFFVLVNFNLFTNVLANGCADLIECTETVSKLTGKKYLFSSKLKGGLNTSSNLELTKENADSIFTQILSLNEYARIPTGEKDTFKIVEARDIRFQTLPTINLNTQSEQIPKNEDYYSATYTFQHPNQDQIRRTSMTLRPLTTRYARITEADHLLIIQETASKLATLLPVIKQMDRELTKDELKNLKAQIIEQKKNEHKSNKSQEKKNNE